MGRITFYEEKNFQGRSYECSTDCSDIHMHLNRCNSCRVDNGCFVVYDRPNFLGNQYFLRKGEYPDYQRWMGFNDCVRSCRMIPTSKVAHKMMLYERPEFGGKVMELTEDVPSLYEYFNSTEVHSCNVIGGHWIFYEHPQYRGRQFLISPSQYRRFNEWGSPSPRVGSIKRIITESRVRLRFRV
uniref:Beta/gamma crystallin 'Greek key' domain-containing protein n=1 Tax=Takifugu rubripes TaxID=31033 RepID=A0A674PPT9_TAKRU